MTSTTRPSPPPRKTRPPTAPFRLSPRMIFFAMAGTLAAGLITHASRGGGTVEWEAVALLVAYLAWLFIEVPVTFRRATVAPAESKTLMAYALARTGVIAGGSLGPLPWTDWSPWLIVPAVVFVAGATVRQIAIRTLGRFYSHHVMRQDEHRVVAGGLYRFVRHPAYAGMLLANIGFTAFFLNPFSGVALVLLGAAVIWRIRVEEYVLWEIPGYSGYAAGKARLLPGMW